jgi:hypothetical protein
MLKRRSLALLCVMLAALVRLSPGAQGPSSSLRCVRIESPEAGDLARQLIEAGFDVPAGGVTEKSFEAIVCGAELELLKQRGLEPEVVAFGRPLRGIGERQPFLAAVPSGYPDLAEIQAQMEAFQAACPSICSVADLTEMYESAPTFEGRHLLAVKISDHVADDEDEPAFLLVGAHHAREIVTPIIALYAIEQLTQLYGQDPAITTLVDEYEIWIAPVWNPDGYEYVFSTDNFWRKNRRILPGGVGSPMNPTAGGTGTVYIDDVGYGQPAPAQ